MLDLYVFYVQLTGDISSLRIGVLREGFEMPGADMKIITLVKDAADRFSMLGANVEEVSVPMHFDGEVLVAIFPFIDSLILSPGR